MTLVELLNRANAGYPDGFLAEFYDTETGELNYEKIHDPNAGDTLAKFIVLELAETFDEDIIDENQISEAERVMNAAAEELYSVVNSIRNKESMNRYEFPVVLSGFGQNAEAGWVNAVENFTGGVTEDHPEPSLIEPLKD